MEGWVDLGVGYILRWFTCPQTVTHPGTNHLIATWPGVEPTTSRSQVLRPNRYTTKPPTSDNSTRCGRGVRLTIQHGVDVVYVWQFNTVWTWCTSDNSTRCGPGVMFAAEVSHQWSCRLDTWQFAVMNIHIFSLSHRAVWGQYRSLLDNEQTCSLLGLNFSTVALIFFSYRTNYTLKCTKLNNMN